MNEVNETPIENSVEVIEDTETIEDNEILFDFRSILESVSWVNIQ